MKLFEISYYLTNSLKYYHESYSNHSFFLGGGRLSGLIISKVSKAYAPEGQHLVSVSVVRSIDFSFAGLEKTVRKELKIWFDKTPQDWKHLHSRTVQYALPNQTTVQLQATSAQQKIRGGLYVCGDFQSNGSIHAAMQSGRVLC